MDQQACAECKCALPPLLSFPSPRCDTCQDYLCDPCGRFTTCGKCIAYLCDQARYEGKRKQREDSPLLKLPNTPKKPRVVAETPVGVEKFPSPRQPPRIRRKRGARYTSMFAVGAKKWFYLTLDDYALWMFLGSKLLTSIQDQKPVEDYETTLPYFGAQWENQKCALFYKPTLQELERGRLQLETYLYRASGTGVAILSKQVVLDIIHTILRPLCFKCLRSDTPVGASVMQDIPLITELAIR
jgi:hypothetical protein